MGCLLLGRGLGGLLLLLLLLVRRLTLGRALRFRLTLSRFSFRGLAFRCLAFRFALGFRGLRRCGGRG